MREINKSCMRKDLQEYWYILPLRGTVRNPRPLQRGLHIVTFPQGLQYGEKDRQSITFLWRKWINLTSVGCPRSISTVWCHVDGVYPCGPPHQNLQPQYCEKHRHIPSDRHPTK